MSVRTTNYNLPNAKHDTTYYRITIDLPNTSEFDLTDANIKLQVQKAQLGSTKYDLIVNKSTAYQIEIPMQIISIVPGLYNYDLLIEYTDRTVRYLAGTFEVEPTITEIP
jgi:hypothetical protein